MTRLLSSFSLCLTLFLLFVAQQGIAEETCNAENGGSCEENSPEIATKKECTDEDDRCAFWASMGECEANPNYMLHNCQKSCDVCNTGKSVEQLIRDLRKKKEEDKEYDIHETLAGVKQEVSGGEHGQKTQEIVDAANDYVENVVMKNATYISVRKECKNRNPQCAYWAAIGECEANPNYMVLQCAPSCQTCDKINFETRCPWDRNTPGILAKSGDLNALFERLTTDPFYKKYQPEIHSSPPDGPWVVTLEKFLTDEECDRLIYLGGVEGYELSRDVGAKKFDGTYDGVTSEGRTSTNAWCNKKCNNDTITQAITSKIENVTSVPETNSEYLQLLRYEIGQFYHTHNDYIPHQLKREPGVRILTVFLYLSDVEEGGGTEFPNLGIEVKPKRGKALIWPSVLNENPDMKDRRTDHQALPVIQGEKFAANAWLHQRDFKGPHGRGCT